MQVKVTHGMSVNDIASNNIKHKETAILYINYDCRGFIRLATVGQPYNYTSLYNVSGSWYSKNTSCYGYLDNAQIN